MCKAALRTARALLPRKPVRVRAHLREKLVKRVLAKASAAHFLHTGRNPLELRASGVELTANSA